MTDVSHSRFDLASFFLVLILACAVRVLYLLRYIAVPGQITDSDRYHTFAVNILKFGVFGIGEKPTAWVPPGIAVGLAGVYKIFGISFQSWASFIILINVGTCCLIWDMARRIFGRKEALIAGLIAAVYPQFLFQTIHTDAKTIMYFGLSLGAWCLVREWQSGKTIWIFLAGIAFGLAYLGRTQLLLFPFFLPIWAYFRYRPTWSKVWTSSIIIVVSMVLIMMLWIGRNYLQFQTLIAGSSGAGLPFAAVNNEKNYNSGRLRGLNMEDTAGSLFTVESGYVDRDGHFTNKFLNLPELEKNRLFTKATLNWIVHNPHKMAVLILFKWKALWFSPQNFNWPKWSRMFNIFLYLGIILPFGFLGFYYLKKINRPPASALWIWVVIALYITVLHSAFEGEIRHRIAFEPGMIILASAGLVFGWSRWRDFISAQNHTHGKEMLSPSGRVQRGREGSRYPDE